MNGDIKRTFDCIKMSAQSQKRIENKLEQNAPDNLPTKTIPYIKKKRLIAIAVAAIMLSFTAVGFAYGDIIFRSLTGHVKYTGIDENGETFSGMTMNSENEALPFKVEGGRILFTLDGSNKDITEFCSDSTYYTYRTPTIDGFYEVIVVGGMPDNVGYYTFIFNENGKFEGGGGMLGDRVSTEDDDYVFPWFENAKMEFMGDVMGR